MTSLKKLMLLVAILIAYAGHTQTSKIDTTCMLTDDAIRGLKLARQAKVLAEKVTVLESDITEYNKKIVALEGIIQTYKSDSVTNANIIASHERDKANMVKESEGLRNDISDLKKTIKKLNRKARWTAIGGLAGMATMAFLLLTK